MQTYREIPPAVYAARRHLDLVADLITRDAVTTAADVAAAHDCSRAQVYKLTARATAALVAQSPGPVPAAGALARAEARVADLVIALATAHAQIARLERDAATRLDVTPRRAHALELVLAQENVSLRGTQRVFDVAFDAQRRPSVGGLRDRLHAHGVTARRLLDAARAQVRNTVTCLAGDDIFFAGTAVKVVAEPRSVAILNVGRWRWHAAEDWALWLEEFPALRLFVSDLGSDLVGALDARELPHAADFFHEMQWWEGVVFAPLARADTAARADALRALDVATMPWSARSRHDLPRVAAADRGAAQAEADFVAAYAACARVRALFAPTRADGTLWTTPAVAAALAAIDADLAPIAHPVGARARAHVARHGRRFAAHRVALDAIAVTLAPGSAWDAHAAKQAVLTQWGFEAVAADATRPMATRLDAQRRARALGRALARHVRDLDAVTVALRRHLAYVPRSSSMIESLNSQLRVTQMVHRTVSDEMLALRALAWNLTPRAAGRRRGRSPYAMLGVDLGQGARRWYDVVLDAAA